MTDATSLSCGMEVVTALASAAELKTGSRVLDVGAGTGRVALALADYGCSVVALEPSLSMLDELQRKRGDRVLHIVCGEAGRLPFSIGLFRHRLRASALSDRRLAVGASRSQYHVAAWWFPPS